MINFVAPIYNQIINLFPGAKGAVYPVALFMPPKKTKFNSFSLFLENYALITLLILRKSLLINAVLS
jgi:hypothetical protein